MLGRSPLPNEKPSLPLHLETDVALRSSSRCLWTGLGFTVLLLMGVSAVALFPNASHASVKPARHFSELAFIGSTPALAPGRIKDIRNKDSRLKDIYIIRPAINDIRGKVSGSLRRSSPVMSSLLSRPSGGGAAVIDRPVTPQKQYGPPPTPPPPGNGNGGGGGDGDGGMGSVLRRYSDSEALFILDVWIPRLRVFCLESQFDDPDGLAPGYKENLHHLESFRSFILSSSNSSIDAGPPFPPLFPTQSAEKNSSTDAGPLFPTRSGEKVLYGLYHISDMDSAFSEVTAEDKVMAITGGLYSSPAGRTLNFREPDKGGILKMKFISANPKHLGAPREGFLDATLQLKATLRHVVERNGMEMVVDPDIADNVDN